jgi:MFS family permease
MAFYTYNFSNNIAFTSAIWVIYLASHGYSPLQIGLFEMLFHTSKFVAEIPTGIFADLLGRRKSLIVCNTLKSIETLLLMTAIGPCIILSFILSGISYAFLGGANEALLWNIAGHADEANRPRLYSHWLSRMFVLALIAEVIGTASGGYLGHILQILPFIAGSLASAVAIIPLLFVPEQRAKVEIGKHLEPLRHLGQGLKAVRHDPSLLGLLLISGLTAGCWQTIYFYYQLYLHGLGFSLSLIGLIVAGSTIMNAIFTALAPLIMRWIPAKVVVPLFVTMEIAGLFLMSLPSSWLSIFGYLVLFQAAFAVLAPAVSTYINERAPEAQRATVLSLETGLFSAAMIVLFPLFGLSVTHVAYNVVYLWTLLALAAGALSIAALVWLLKRGLASRKAQ